LNAETLAQALLQAVRAQAFGSTPDTLRQGEPLAHFPSLDLALVAFPRGAAPVFANVLFSREHPQGRVAQIAAGAGSVAGIHYLADQRNAAHESLLWRPDADWSRVEFQTLAGHGALRFVAPYPASLFKLMVAVGVALGVDRGRFGWPALAVEDMIVASSNSATTELVALLHRHALVEPLHRHFETLGLTTLRLRGTQADGGWGNAAGAGVGQIQMTAWDTARLLWLLDADAPPAPWLAPGQRLVSVASRTRLRGWLEGQGLHEILSSTVLAGVPGWVPGLPARLPAHWIAGDGSVQVGDEHYPGDVRAANAAAEVRFAHKTGTTENYASDAGIVRGLAPARRHYIVALLSNLGTRYAPTPACATTWKLPALGAAIDATMARWLDA
jgi:hypothetical protein